MLADFAVTKFFYGDCVWSNLFQGNIKSDAVVSGRYVTLGPWKGHLK
jgi:hypothetical protein